MPNWWSGAFEFLQNSTLGLRYARLKMDYQKVALLPQFWGKIDGYPLWLDVACLPEVPLSWVTVPWQEHFILMVLGFWIFQNSIPGLRNECLNTNKQFSPNLEKFNRRLPSLNGRSSAPWGAIDLGPFSMASQCPTDDLGLLNFCKTPL